MRHRLPLVITATTLCAGLALSSCSNDTVSGSPSTPGTSADSAAPGSGKSLPHSGAPKVENPLPATALEGSPCESALTPADLERFLGNADPAKPGEDQLGKSCFWSNAAGSGASFTVTYQTKVDEGLSLAYQNVKPKAARWQELAPVQDYPAVGYLPDGDDPNNNSGCQVVVGTSDDLTFSVGIIIGDTARGKKDPCDVGRNVADAVMTNLKARAK